MNTTSIINRRHPYYDSTCLDWEKWRLTYAGGELFRDRFLKKFTKRESEPDFEARRHMSVVPAFSKAAINDVRNSIYQRMRDISRLGGSSAYQRAVGGLDGGVNKRGLNMNAFMGKEVLTEALIMGRCGIYIDAPSQQPLSAADEAGNRPYAYLYSVEDILSWATTRPEDPSDFSALLLRDTAWAYDPITLLPLESYERFRRLWINPETGLVNCQFYNVRGEEVDALGQPGGPIELKLTKIPFVMVDIGDSLMRDICQYQIALLNLSSSDINYACKSNFIFYVEEADPYEYGKHLKTGTNDGTAMAGGQNSADTTISVGNMQGRRYPKGAQAPKFISPPSEPLKASLELQDNLKDDIRKIISVALQNMPTRSSAESKAMDNQGLEAGLSFIGLVLENAERRLCEHWAAYENRIPSRRQVATIKYPDQYSLKSDEDRINESTKLAKLMSSIPGRTVKRELGKLTTYKLFSGLVSVEKLEQMFQEIDAANYTISDPLTIIQATEAGLVSDQTASVALGYDDDEYLKAQADQAARAARIVQAQIANKPGPLHIPGEREAAKSIQPPETEGAFADDLQAAGARGVPALSADPKGEAQAEKAESRQTALRPDRKRGTRGRGKPKAGIS